MPERRRTKLPRLIKETTASFIPLIRQLSFFREARKNQNQPRLLVIHDSEGWQRFAAVVKVVRRQADLLEIVRALRAAGRFAGRLDRRQQERDQDADDRDHDQQLDERERLASATDVLPIAAMYPPLLFRRRPPNAWPTLRIISTPRESSA